MSANHLVALWPTLVAELYQVMTQMEQDLCGDIGIRGSVEELRGSREEHWLQLYLAACKLLDALCSLPTWYLSQFQMYLWSFMPLVNIPKSAAKPAGAGAAESFLPYMSRLAELFRKKYGKLTKAELERAIPYGRCDTWTA